MDAWIPIVAALWIVCGVIQIGVTVACMQRGFPRIAKDSYRDDLAFALFFSLFGLPGLVIAVFGSGLCKHGWYIRYRDVSEQKES